MAKDNGPWGNNNENISPWGESSEKLNKSKVIEFLKLISLP